MADPGTGSEFSSDELDRLEDALERLGEPDAADALSDLPPDLPPHLRARLGEYEAVLALAREALPFEDVPPGLLDGVLAEASRAPAPAPTVAPGPSWWERLRRSFVLPGAALAGTAALLLWVASPPSERDEGSLIEAEKAPAPAPAAPELPRAERPAQAAPADMPEEAGLQQAPGAADDGDPVEEAAASAPAPALAPAEAKPARGGSPAKRKAEVEPPPPLPGLDVPDAKRSDVDKDAVRDQLERGDLARAKGRCKAAGDEYVQVARSTGPAAERARALAGLGLCAADEADAERYFDAARALDSSVDAYIQREGDAGAKRVKAKSKPPSAEGL